MGKYTADIEIAVRGGQQIDGAIKSLNRLNNSVNVVNRNAKLLEGKGFNVASMENYSRAVGKAERALRKAAEGTDLERQAVNRLVTAMDAENKARSRRNFLIAQEVANRRRVVATADAGFGVQGPRAANVKAPRGPASPIGGMRTGRAATAGAGIGSRLGGAVSGAVIGGSFPLLFGQGAGAAAGGAIGGLAGGLLGPGGSFAGSLLGTLLGDIASKGQRVKELATDIGFTAEQTKRLQEAFKLAGSESDKFIESVQNIRGLSLSLDDQADSIQLVSKLTEVYGGKIEKVTNAFTSALESGKVTQATLNQLTSQGIPIQDELAKKYGVSRDKLLQMAKDGKISVQELVDVLVDMGNKGVAKTGKTESGFKKLKKSVDSLGSALAALGGALVGIFEGPFNFILDGLARITSTAAESINIISDLLKFSNPTKVETTAAIQAGRMPRGGRQSVIDVIGQDRLSQIEKAAGPGIFGLGTNVPKVLELLKQQPEFKLTETKIGKIDTPSQLPPSGTGSSGRKGAADQAAQAEQQIQERLRGLTREIELTSQIGTIKELQFQAEMDGNKELQARLQGEERIIQIMQATAQSLDGITDQRLQQKILAKAEGEILVARQDTALEMQRIEAERTKSFDEIIAGLDLELALKSATTEQAREQLRLEAEIAKLRGQGFTPEQVDAITAKKTELAAPKTDQQNITEKIATLKTEIADLTSISNIAITSAEGIGNAFAQSFRGLISGTMTAKEALGSFFKSVADMFLEMAAQIIAKQITMIILQTILKALGAFGGGVPGANSASALGTNPNVAAYAPLANGGTFANGIAKFASGGAFTNSVVSSPTMFKFADGGTMRTGLMGEAGPEAIMPLSRGPGGRLGVMASGGGGDVNVVVNVDAKGSSVEGNEQGANQLGRVISAAVQSELIKQQRPGGILAR